MVICHGHWCLTWSLNWLKKWRRSDPCHSWDQKQVSTAGFTEGTFTYPYCSIQESTESEGNAKVKGNTSEALLKLGWWCAGMPLLVLVQEQLQVRSGLGCVFSMPEGWHSLPEWPNHDLHSVKGYESHYHRVCQERSQNTNRWVLHWEYYLANYLLVQNDILCTIHRILYTQTSRWSLAVGLLCRASCLSLRFFPSFTREHQHLQQKTSHILKASIQNGWSSVDQGSGS